MGEERLLGESLTDARNPAPAAGAPRPPHLRALTAVRFFAALHVTLYHIVRPFSLWGPLTGFFSAGYTGVSFFFVLSGFILTYSHAGERATGTTFAKRFYFARFARIYPVYLVTMLVAAVVSWSQFAQRIHILAFVADLAMVQTWSLRMVSFFNVPAWSVASEAFFYLVFPFVYLKLTPSSRMRGVLAAGLFWMLAMVMPVVCLVWFPAGAWHEGLGIFAFWVRRFPVFALPEFLCGISVAWLLLRFRPSRRTASWMGVAAVVGLMVALLVSERLPALALHNGLLIPLYAMLLLGLSENTVLASMLSSAPLVLLGEASYALYLVHFELNTWWEHAFHASGSIAAAVWKLAILLPLAIALHLWVERPCRKSLLVWWNRRHPVIAGT
ncbi:MAG: acyltransferase [Acidobacteriota bacterium]